MGGGGVVVWVVGDATIKASETGTSFKQALYFKEIGFNLHDTMIYRKLGPPPLNHRRYEQDFEYMFVLTKGSLKTFNPLKIPCKHAGEKITGTRRNNGTDELSPSHGIGGHYNDTKIIGNIWGYYVGNNKSTKDKVAFQHPATFPEALAEDHILSWSNPDDLVFDPMCGSGTTLKMAKKNGRRYLGIDVSEEYCDIARQRLDLV